MGIKSDRLVRQRSRSRMLLSAVILVVFGIWTAWYVVRHPHEFRTILQVPIGHLVSLYLLFFLTMVCNGIFMRDVVMAFGTRLGVRAWLPLSFLSSFVNFLMPMRGGAGFRAVYLKTVHRFAISDFVSTLSAMYLIYLSVHAAIGLGALAVLWRQQGSFSLRLFALFAIVLISCLAAIALHSRIPAFSRFPLRQVAAVIRGWRNLHANPHILARLILTACIFALLSASQYKIAFAAYGVDLSAAQVLMFVAARNMAMFVSVTPGALGVVEVLAVYLGRVMDYAPAEALMVQALIRTVTLTTLMASFVFASRALGKDYQSIRREVSGDDRDE
jgi:uncharacterized membrane protein YbhN (UPF0104 family)